MKTRLSIFLIILALIAGMVSCGGGGVEYDLAISSTAGGSVTAPGEAGPYTYDEGIVVNLVAEAEEGYQFVNWTGDVNYIADVEDATTTITMQGDYEITANFEAIPPLQYNLTISSTTGGSVTAPGEGTFTYDCGMAVDLVATLDNGYQFVNWTGDVGTIANVNAASTTITISEHHSITASFAIEICDWYDLDAIRDNLGGSYLLMNDLDSTTAGYTELAATTANEGQGWHPIGSLLAADPTGHEIVDLVSPFTGMLDGQGYEIRDLFINRPDEGCVGLFGCLGSGGIIQDVGVVNVTVTGDEYVGGLVGYNRGTVSNFYSTGSVTGVSWVGGLVGYNWGTVSNSYSTGSVTGNGHVGGLVGGNQWSPGVSSSVSNSYFTGSITGSRAVGGLVGTIGSGTVSDSYFTGSVTGDKHVGGLVGWNHEGIVSNSYYNYDEVLINGDNIISIGALFGKDFEQWLANDKFLDVSERLSQEHGYYLINNVNDFKQLLVFGQDDSLKFRLKDDLDLDTEANFYIPYLAGEFDGNGHKISNLSFSFDFISQVGLFGYLADGGKVTGVGVDNVTISGGGGVGGLVGTNFGGTVSNSYSSGSMIHGLSAGGLVGENHGTVGNSYSTGSVTGEWDVGGLVGWNDGTVRNSYYSYDEVFINGKNIVTIGALFAEDFEQWLANDKFLDVNERLSQEDGYYLINNVNDFKQLLAFGQDDSLKFRLKDDLDLANEANFYIPYLAGEFDGNGHKISSLSFSFDFVSRVGLFGYLAFSGKVTQVGVENVNIIGCSHVGSLVGWNSGTVSNSYASGRVSGDHQVGGLVGWNHMGTASKSYFSGSVTGNGHVGGLVGRNQFGTVSNSYSTGSVTGYQWVAGLVGQNLWGTVSNSYSTGSVTGDEHVGGLVGWNKEGSVSNSFWDTETSGQSTSAGGTGKTTAEMQDIATFSGVGWDIYAVASGETNPTYTWNIVDNETYPFLSWQSVS